jgi:hypothetical protein
MARPGSLPPPDDPSLAPLALALQGESNPRPLECDSDSRSVPAEEPSTNTRRIARLEIDDFFRGLAKGASERPAAEDTAQDTTHGTGGGLQIDSPSTVGFRCVSATHRARGASWSSKRPLMRRKTVTGLVNAAYARIEGTRPLAARSCQPGSRPTGVILWGDRRATRCSLHVRARRTRRSRAR